MATALCPRQVRGVTSNEAEKFSVPVGVASIISGMEGKSKPATPPMTDNLKAEDKGHAFRSGLPPTSQISSYASPLQVHL